jgi:hypothetical protein
VRPNGRDGPGESLEGSGDVSGSWVSISEAARRLGISPRAVRLRIDRRQMTSRPVGNTGREVWVASSDVPAHGTGDSPGLPGTEALLERAARAEGETTLLRAALARVEDELASKGALVATLTAALAEERAARTEATLLRDALAREADHAGRERARADRLEAALLEARRPWLAKVLEGLRRKG